MLTEVAFIVGTPIVVQIRAPNPLGMRLGGMVEVYLKGP